LQRLRATGAGKNLEEPPVTTSLESFRSQTVLVTGAAGTIGSALCEHLAPYAKALRCLDHNESELFFLHERLRHKGRVAPQLGDIRDLERLRFAMSGVDVVFHTAALKHVGLGEYNPFEVVRTNLEGLNNIIRAALDHEVGRVVFTSSDKAVNPTNVMGASKMMGERLVSAANEIRGTRRSRFSAVRFGNVVGSRGSVIPIFASQLLRGEELTLTDEGMTRYVMTIDEAASLVLQAADRAQGGEVFVTKMKALSVVDLAYAVGEVIGRDVQIRRIGARPGEKLYEELISEEEQSRALDIGRFLVIPPERPAEAPGVAKSFMFPDSQPVTREWHSGKEKLMSRQEIVAWLREHNVLAPYLRPGAV
jgi:UDP-N-acetylglucosamine 4,6-dehydratase